MLRLFVNTLSADEKYFLCNTENLPEPIQMELSKKLKIFYSICYCISESLIWFQTFPKKMLSVIASVFPKL